MAVPARNNENNRSWDNLPAIETQSPMDRYMAKLDFDDEVGNWELESAKREMKRGIQLLEVGCSMAGNDQNAQQVVAVHLKAYTENQLYRAKLRQQQ